MEKEKSEAYRIANINKEKDSLFLLMCNKIIRNLSAIRNESFYEFKNINDFHEPRKKDSGLYSLLDKCYHIIYNIGSPSSIPEFLNRVASKKKKQTQPGHSDNGKFLGICHFRWDWKGYTLYEDELQALKKYLSENGSDITTKTTFKNVEVSGKIINTGVEFPNSDNKMLHNQFCISLNNTEKSTVISFDFYGSNHDYNHGIVELQNKELLNALNCFLSDACSGGLNFNNFCDEFGYDTDSRNAEKIHNACVESNNKALLIFDDIYDAVNELNELENI